MSSLKIPSGTYDSTWDDKNRVIIPAPLRRYYKGTLFVTQRTIKCISIFLPEKWDEYRDNIQKAFDMKAIEYKEYDRLKRCEISAARESVVDQKSGRISIAPKVREWAYLKDKKDCIVMSTDICLEIWDSDYYYNTYLNDNLDYIQEAANKVGAMSASGERKEEKA